MFLKAINYRHQDIEQIAVIAANSEQITYHRLYSQARNLSKIIGNLPIHSHLTGIFLPNSTQYIIIFFAITFLDRVMSPIHVHSQKAEVQNTVSYDDLKLIMTNTKYQKVLEIYLTSFEHTIMVFHIEKDSFENIRTGKNPFWGFKWQLSLSL